jgi:hypothetical protein
MLIITIIENTVGNYWRYGTSCLQGWRLDLRSGARELQTTSWQDLRLATAPPPLTQPLLMAAYKEQSMQRRNSNVFVFCASNSN